jgi:hypothetical protein
MANLNLPKSVRQVIVLSSSANGPATPVIVYGASSDKKKGSKMLRSIEKGARRLAKAQASAASSYLDRHQKSNTEKKNGWVKDIKKNVVKSVKVGKKAAKSKS